MWVSPVKVHRDDEVTGASDVKRGWESCDCSTWRRAGSGGSYHCV